MIVITPGRRQLFDGRGRALIITVGHDGVVEIQHQDEPGHIIDRRIARLAAEIITEVGSDAVIAQLDAAAAAAAAGLATTPVEPPARGQAVMACRCGQVMDAADMCRDEPPGDHPRSTAVIRPIICWRCAA